MTIPRYELALSEYVIDRAFGGADLFAVNLVPVKRVCENFTVRELYLPVNGAGPDAYGKSFVLDHIPTGRLVFGGPASPADEAGCRAMAASLHSAPVNWSLAEPEMPPGMVRFVVMAGGLAARGESIDWHRWRRKWRRKERSNAE